MEEIDERKPAVPRPCTVEFRFEVTIYPVRFTLDKKPRVPRPSKVEFRVGCKELILERNPEDPSPCIVELIVSLSPAEDKKPRVPRPSKVEFRVG